MRAIRRSNKNCPLTGDVEADSQGKDQKAAEDTKANPGVPVKDHLLDYLVSENDVEPQEETGAHEAVDREENDECGGD